MVISNPKRVFWEALILTVVIFMLGLLIGISFEERKLNEVSNYYSESDAFMMDLFAMNNLIQEGEVSCEMLIDSSVNFADDIYHEAMLLEKYEDAGKVTDGMRILHKKYDTLRTLLWMNIIDIKDECGGVQSVIYLYNYDTKDLVEKATNTVWSKVLGDLKAVHEDIILIPIAVDSDLNSLNSLIEDYNITSYPVVIVNEKHVIGELGTYEDVEEYLN